MGFADDIDAIVTAHAFFTRRDKALRFVGPENEKVVILTVFGWLRAKVRNSAISVVDCVAKIFERLSSASIGTRNSSNIGADHDRVAFAGAGLQMDARRVLAERVTLRDGKLQSSELIYDARAFPAMQPA